MIESINKNNSLEDKIDFNYFMYKTNNLWREVSIYTSYFAKDAEESKVHF